MKLSARNQLAGTIKRVVPGAINTEITLEIGNGVDVVAVITSESVERLNLGVGKRAYAVVKASDVLIAIDSRGGCSQVGAARPPFFLARPERDGKRLPHEQDVMIDFSRNYFELFGLPQRFESDSASLENAYRRLQTEVHPDRFASAGEQEKRLALQSSARVNEAYRALKDPVSRAQYLLSLHGIDALSETDTQLPMDFLEQQLERREDAAQAVSANDSSALAAILADVRREANDLVSELVHAIDEQRSFADARMPVRELKFLAKLANDLDAMQSSLDD